MKLVAWVVGYVVFLALAITACGSGGAPSDVVTLDGLTIPITDEVSGPYTLAGSVVHLQSSGLKLNDGYDDIDLVSGQTSFFFKNKLPAGSEYNVKIVTQPVGQTCSVSYGHGKIRSTERGVIVKCELPARYAYILKSNDILRYVFDENTGTMVGGDPVEWTTSPYTTSYYSLTKHPLQNYIFVFHAFEHKLLSYHVDNETGALNLKDTKLTENQTADAFRVRITKDGRYVYVGGKKNGLYAYRFDDETGSLTEIGANNDIIVTAGAPDGVLLDDFEMDPNGEYMYGSNDVNGISTLKIDKDSGKLQYVDRHLGAQGATMLSMTPNDRYLFASSTNQSKIQAIEVTMDGVLSEIHEILLSVNTEFWSAIDVDPTGKKVFMNEPVSKLMGAYSVADLIGPPANQFQNAVETETSKSHRSFFSFSPDGRFVYSQHHEIPDDARGMDAYDLKAPLTTKGYDKAPLPPEASEGLAILIY